MIQIYIIFKEDSFPIDRKKELYRYENKKEAEEHLEILRRRNPNTRFWIEEGETL